MPVAGSHLFPEQGYENNDIQYIPEVYNFNNHNFKFREKTTILVFQIQDSSHPM